MLQIGRRSFIAGVSLLACSQWSVLSAMALPVMRVSKDPNCGCCTGWLRHIRASGIRATAIDIVDLASLKTRLEVPKDLASCHTAEIGGYVIEGHVPAAAIKQLLADRPAATGLAVPDMPVGSPGMEVAEIPAEIYEVVLFGPSLRQSYARFKGLDEL